MHFKKNIQFSPELDKKQYEDLERSITKYVGEGIVIDINEIKKTLDNLSPARKKRLEFAIHLELPINENNYIRPILENIPLALKWSAAAAFVITMAAYRINEKYYSASITGLIGGALTLMG